MNNKIPITRGQASALLEIARAVVVDDVGVCFHTIYEEAAEVGDLWFEAMFEDPEGRQFEFNVDVKEGITWDGVQVSIPHEGQELLIRPLVETTDMARWHEYASRIEAQTVAGDKIRVDLRPGTHRLKLWRDEGTAPEGVKVTARQKGKYTFYDYKFPELAPRLPRAAYNEPVVADIMGRRWKITVKADYGGHSPAVWFETTDEPLTEPDPTGIAGDYSYWFGQPSFIQGERLPHLDGKSAYPLQTRETGWGDSGNENVFVTFDEQGIPNGLYVEASCH